MTDINDLRSQLPIDQIAAQLGTDRATTQQAIDLLLPTLVGGLDANARDPQAAASLERALADHRNDLYAQPDPERVDTADGEKIARHIFGGNTDEIVTRLGGASGGGASLIQKLLPILAPIVLSWLASQFFGRGQSSSGQAPAPQQTQEPSQQQQGGGLGDILGGILGGGLGGMFGSGASTPSARGGTGDVSNVQLPDVFNRPADVQRRQDSGATSAQDGSDPLSELLGGLLGGGRR